jgi:hypothetical protein
VIGHFVNPIAIPVVCVKLGSEAVGLHPELTNFATAHFRSEVTESVFRPFSAFPANTFHQGGVAGEDIVIDQGRGLVLYCVCTVCGA